MVQKIIINMIKDFSEKEKEIGNYILNCPTEIVSLTSEELAKNIGVSQSSIIKFVKKIGFKGFTVFKMELSKELAVKDTNERLYTEITINDSLKEIGEKILHENISALTDTISTVNNENLEKIVNLIDNSRMILILGSGMSSIVARDLELKLIKLGKVAYHHENKQMQLMHLSVMGENDLVIAISHTGETKEVIEVVDAAKKRSLKTITMTSLGKNSLTQLGDLNLFTISRESMLRTAAISSRMAQMILIDLIFLALMQQNYEQAKNYIETSRDIVGWKKS